MANLCTNARAERLLDVLGARWRFTGPIQMIAAPDLAARTIDPGKFIDFLSGRLRHRFIIEPHDLQQRLSDIDLRPDADGRFRVNDLFCGNDTWQAAVESLVAETDLVAMDLRGFSPQNKGCVYELQMLLDTVPASRIVVFAVAPPTCRSSTARWPTVREQWCQRRRTDQTAIRLSCWTSRTTTGAPSTCF